MAAISDFVESIRSKKEIVDLVDVGDDVRLGMENEIVERPPDEFCQVRLYKTVPFSDFPPNCALVALFELPAIFARCPACILAKGHAERARLRVAQRQPDVRDRDCSICQEQFGLFNAPLYVVLMRRNPERLFEGPTKMVLA